MMTRRDKTTALSRLGRPHAGWANTPVVRGSNGPLTIALDPAIAADRIEQGVDGLRQFGIGASWGGYESLVLPVDFSHTRLAGRRPAPGYMLRLHIGLEDPADLIQDLDAMLRPLA